MRKAALGFTLLATAMLVSPSKLAIASCAERPDSAARFQFLHQQLGQTVERERTWANRWGIGWAGLTTVQLVGALALPAPKYDEKRKDLYVGAVASSTGMIPTLLYRPRALAHSDVLDRSGESCEDLAALESMLESASDDERFMHSFLSHAAGVLFNIGTGLFLGLELHHWGSAALSMGVGIPLAEFMLRTRPTDAIDAQERYRAGDFHAESRRPAQPTLKISLLLNRDTFGVGFTL